MSRTRYVYLLHYEQPIGDTTRPRMWAQHYVGSFWSEERLEQHRNGTSRVCIVAAFHARGIGFTLARVTRGSKDLERRIKNYGHFKDFCPLCTPSPKKGLWARKPPPRRNRKHDIPSTGRAAARSGAGAGTEDPEAADPADADGGMVA